MKKWLSIALAILLLWGCAPVTPAETTAPTETQTPAVTRPPETEPTVTEPQETQPQETQPQETEPLWAPGSVEDQTQGAVTSVRIEVQGSAGMTFLGENLLLFNSNDNKRLRLLNPETGEELAGTSFATYLHAQRDNLWTIADDMLILCNRQVSSVGFYDMQLNLVKNVRIPSEAEYDVFVSEDGQRLYYATGNQLRVMDLNTEEVKTIYTNTQSNGADIFINAILCDGKVACIGYNTVEYRQSYVLLETGQIRKSLGSEWNNSWGEMYCVRQWNNSYFEKLVGTYGNEPQSLYLKQVEEDFFLMEAQSMALAVTRGENYQWTFDMYDLVEGTNPASIALDLGTYVEIRDAEMDPDGQHIWIQAIENSTGHVLLYKWDTSLYQTGDTQSYLGKRYTQKDPDDEGLERCRQWANALEETYGVDILLNKEPKKPADYGFTPLWQVPSIEQSLAVLEKTLAKYPEGFFRTLGSLSGNGKLQIAVVESFDGEHERWTDSQYYRSGGNACIMIMLGIHQERLFDRALGQAIEEYLSKDTNLLDNWNACNREGFEYSKDKIDDYTGMGSEFINASDKASRRADIGSIFEYSMMIDDSFGAKVLSDKLRTLCEAIREGFGLQDYADPLPWEQHVKTTD